MLGAIGFGIPTIIIAIVFVVHLARSRYSRRHHPNYRVGTRYHRHFYRGLRPVPDFQRCRVTSTWGGEKKKRRGKYVRRNSTRRCCDGVLARARVRFARLGVVSGAEERFVAESICPRHMQARVAESAFYRGPWYYFPSGMIEGRTCDAVYIATVICMSHESPNNALNKNRSCARTLRDRSEIKRWGFFST